MEETKNKFELSKWIIQLEENDRQILYDQLTSGVLNKEPRDTLFYVFLIKLYKYLEKNGLGPAQEESQISNLVLNLKETQKQTLYDALVSSISNISDRDTILHIFLWKLDQLLSY
ncbi:hypothetical protein B1J93_08575 [Leptospira kirschneri serovar Pomona]|uniref:Uncharacterized protein n=2 Tax=Leptospira TaxID=171 RepID=A0A1T1DQ80_9LEPT|nr:MULTISPECIES: hypothetical protein [Leptospira]EKR71804.1 hypothetical protein LEP1GSC041_0547 [Leptospira noguchii str. 2006001870]EMO39523.1 hypothetical protein LEP1GSC186_3229 [Leptospira noguchii serovar Autumnalis str. ZUN142]OOV43025.1 hypothetical protein B1J93_08575 [Leptospira kirschneri serovar Pomona]UOG50868.1 hypothetical protein MAL00_19550 [Leptospira noguchii]